MKLLAKHGGRGDREKYKRLSKFHKYKFATDAGAIFHRESNLQWSDSDVKDASAELIYFPIQKTETSPVVSQSPIRSAVKGSTKAYGKEERG